MSRAELSIYNEATGFTITSRNRGGRDLSDLDDSRSSQWQEAVAEGVFLPIRLVQDDGFGVRVVVDEPLTPDEEANWVDHWTARLVIADGVLTISGGIEYLWGEDMEDYTKFLKVPPGEYRADFYTYIPGVNGWYCLQAAPGEKEPQGAYFRRTRPDAEFPIWLKAECQEDPEQDPGHESEWEDDGTDYDEEDEDRGPAYLDFLLHLTPASRLTPDQMPAAQPLSDNEDEAGWIPITVAPRKPAEFPMGLIAEETEDEEE